MSIIRVETVRRVVVQVKDVSLVATTVPNGVEVAMNGPNYSGDSIILTPTLFSDLVKSFTEMLEVKSPAEKTVVLQNSVEEKIPPKGINPGGKKIAHKTKGGWKRVNRKIGLNSALRWDSTQLKTVAKILVADKGTWKDAGDAVGRTAKAVNVRVYKGLVPGVDYIKVRKTAGPLKEKE